MFRETLLESFPMARRRKRWPMAAAFTIELIVAGVLIMVPLLSTGVLPVFAHTPPTYTPLQPIERVRVDPAAGHSGPSEGIPHTTVVTLAPTNSNQIHLGPPQPIPDGPIVPIDLGPSNRRDQLVNVIGNNKNGSNVRRGDDTSRVTVISQLQEARLVNRVEPVYPRMAIIANIRGEVKLHAIIARDGRIQSLSVTSGHPVLAAAAVDAVKQWRYQPYILNGNPVEVDTLITVNFKRAGD